MKGIDIMRQLNNLSQRPLELLFDKYALTMGQAIFGTEWQNKRTVFDVFYRVNPDEAAFSIYAGLETLIEFIEKLHFTDEDIEYLHSLKDLDYDFVEYLRNFKFTGTVYSYREGSVIFPMEPIVRVEATFFEAVIIEAAMLCLINHQSLIATKAARVTYAAEGDPVMDMGLRRAQGFDAAILGSRACLIGGCGSTSNELAAKMYGAADKGTMSHAYVQCFPDEYTAFKLWAQKNPLNMTFLIDTYNIMDKGLPAAIKVMVELKAENKLPPNYGVRIDSGDLARMSKDVRKKLDEAGLKNAKICVSSDLDEDTILDLKRVQRAPIDTWGVGTRMITSASNPAFGGVYKLVAIEDEEGRLENKIKLSENPIKVTNPGKKNVIRFTSLENGMFLGDVICFDYEQINEELDYEMFDPVHTEKRKILKGGTYRAERLLIPIFIEGERVYDPPVLQDVVDYAEGQRERLWEEHKRFKNPQTYHVDLSFALWSEKEHLKEKMRRA